MQNRLGRLPVSHQKLLVGWCWPWRLFSPRRDRPGPVPSQESSCHPG